MITISTDDLQLLTVHLFIVTINMHIVPERELSCFLDQLRPSRTARKALPDLGVWKVCGRTRSPHIGGFHIWGRFAVSSPQCIIFFFFSPTLRRDKVSITATCRQISQLFPHHGVRASVSRMQIQLMPLSLPADDSTCPSTPAHESH